MANPRKHVVRRSQKTGQMGAQSPDATTRKNTVLSGDLQKGKDPFRRIQKRITHGQSPYAVQDEDGLLGVSSNPAVTQIIMPLASENLGRLIIIRKIDATVNNVRLTAQDFFGRIGPTNTPDIYLREVEATAGLMAFRRGPTVYSWLVLWEYGDVSDIP